MFKKSNKNNNNGLLALPTRIFGGLAILITVALITGALWLSSEPTSEAQSAVDGDLYIYRDGLANRWDDWSWASTIQFEASNPVKEGTAAMAVTYNQGWAGFYLHSDDAINTANYDALRFWLHGGQSGGQQLRIVLADQDNKLLEDSAVSISAQAETWRLVEIPLSELGNPSAIHGIVWQEATGEGQTLFYLDGVGLIRRVTGDTPAAESTEEPAQVEEEEEEEPQIYREVGDDAPESAAEVPTQVPTQEAPTQVPTQEAPTQEEPAQEAPTQAPAQEAPAQETPTQAPAQTLERLQTNIYGDSLDTGWVNWSWGSTIDFASGTVVKEGNASIAVTYNEAWVGLYLHSKQPLSTASYDTLRFWLHGGQSGGQELRVVLADQGNNLLEKSAVNITAQAGTWSLVEIPLSQLGKPSSLGGIVWQDVTGGAQPTFYIDGVALVGAASATTPASSASEAPAQVESTSQTNIYGDSLDTEWVNWSWGSTIDFASGAVVKEGNASIAVTYNEAWVGLYLHSKQPLSTASYDTLRFWLHGGQSGGQQLRVVLADQGNNLLEKSAVSITAQAGTWSLVEIPLSQLGKPSSLGGIVWQDVTGGAQATFYIDGVTLVGRQSATTPAAEAPTQAESASQTNIYGDSLDTGWVNWSWGSTIDFASGAVVKEGNASIAVTYNEAWVGLYLHSKQPLSTASYDTLRFWLHGGQSGGQELRVVLADQGNNLLEKSAVSITAQAGTWSLVEIPLSQLGKPSSLGGIVWQDTTGGAQATFHIDGVALVGAASATTPASEAPTQAESTSQSNIYGDGLDTGWVNWSWGSTIDFASGTVVKEGNAAIAVTYNEAWVGLYLHSKQPLSTASYDTLRFWLHGGQSGGQQLRVVLADQGNNLLEGSAVSISAQAGTWSLIEIPLSQLGNPSSLGGIVWQEAKGEAQATFYIDAVALIGGGTAARAPEAAASGPVGGPALTVDTATEQHKINAHIYGINFATEELATDLQLPINRWGGNATTRYNWQNDTSNRASDWYFENIPNENDNVEQLPAGSRSDKFVEQNQATGTSSLLTIPLIGWTAKDRENKACGFSVAKYGPQEKSDPWKADCGNGVRPDGSLITNNDPADTSIPIDPTFVQDWIRHLTQRYGSAQDGGVQFYNLDNEPMLWHYTHRDVHPQATSYDELRDLSYLYGAAVKKADPSAQTLGPVLWGWTAYFYSAVDQESNRWLNPPDRGAHGNTPLVEWYLQQMSAYEQQHGVRILDYLDLHYYPQASGVPLSAKVDANTQALRLRSTRSLWDASYKDESWIDEPVRLIPRMREWVNQHYPGTKLAITEYNWGALDHLNGALAQADVLGIFGREALDLATLWNRPDFNDPGAYAFRLYRNYDGKGSTFGDISLSANSTNQDQLAIYAAKRSSDDALTLIIINKSQSPLTSSLTLTGTSATNAELYRYSAANLSAIVRETDQTVSRGSLTADYPANSITLLVLQ